MKLYLKKVLFTTLFAGGIIGSAWLILMLLQALQITTTNIIYIVALCAGMVIMLCCAYLIRVCNKNAQTVYINNEPKVIKRTNKQKKAKTPKYSIDSDFAAVIKTKENILHAAAFLTIVVIVSIALAISASIPVLAIVIGAIVLVIISAVAFFMINTLLWCLVHSLWEKRRVSQK